MRHRLLGLTLCLVPAAAFAVPALDMDSVAGVYKARFPNALADGSKFTSEDVLEVVKVSPARAYVRAHLEFYNGHICSTAAVFHAEGDSLVWRNRIDKNTTCELSLTFSGGKVTFHDKDDVCREEDCGMRGRFEGASFPTAGRRPIRYMPRLLASQEYRDAMKAASQ